MDQFNTVPNRSLQPAQRRQQRRKPARPPHRRPARRKKRWPLLLFVPMVLVIALLALAIVAMIGLRLTFANTILPGVSVGDVALGGYTPQEAAVQLEREWQTLTVSADGQQQTLAADSLGIALDVSATVERAFAQGHGEGGMTALFNDVNVAPVLNFDPVQVMERLAQLAPQFEISPVNAGFTLVDGTLQAAPARAGNRLDAARLVTALSAQPETVFKEGVLVLPFVPAQATISDVSPLLAQARAIMDRQPEFRLYDPVTGDSRYWRPERDDWALWFTAQITGTGADRLLLQADSGAVGAYLNQMAAQTFDASRSLDIQAATATINSALAQGIPETIILQVEHQARTHVVQPGETLTSIGWDYGFPYLYLIRANDGLQSVSIGQEIIIPPADYFLSDFPVNPDKRIVVDISEQRTRVYEHDVLLYDWVTSTGVSDSPTWTGVYQILSHEPNAYAANWNLYMPNFMGVYRPVPDVDFTNGFHGFPTRSGGQLLWQNNLGSRVTYGCIMLSDRNMQILYDWAENGVVVEIRP